MISRKGALVVSSLLALSLAAHSQTAVPAVAPAAAKPVSDSSTFLKFSSDVTADQQTLVRSDINRLTAKNLNIVDASMSQIMGLPQAITSANMLSWLSDRIQYVVSQDFDLEKNLYIVQNSGFQYENPDVLPDLPDVGSVKSPSDDSSSSSKVVMVMANIGGGIYLEGKANKVLLDVQAPGLGDIPMTSPRIGLLQVGQGLFALLGPQRNQVNPPPDIHNPDSAYMRLSTLFHEARHSDGNGKSLGFLHIICPAGHPYEGYAACDDSLNGAYTVGAIVGKTLAENCSECSVAQKESLRLNYLDSFSRIIKVFHPHPIDATKMKELQAIKEACDKLGKVAQFLAGKQCASVDAEIAEMEKNAAVVIQATNWDPRPEGHR